MSEFKTLVYFDIEATGLKSSGRPRICELTFLAVNMKDVLELNVNDYNMKGQNKEVLLPRIVNKLTLCIYPMATIVPQVSDMTGLDNYNLSGQSKFNKSTGDLINNFLSCLPSPVCLIAHNGNAYDFPLLKAELENAGVQLGPEIFCADSYVGIKEIFAKRRNRFEREETKKEEYIQKEEMKIAKIELDALADLVNSGVFEEEMSEGISDNVEHFWSAYSSKQENEKTPCKIKDNVALCIKPRTAKQNSYKAKSTSRKKLDFSAPTSFSLINLHLHLLGYRPMQSHGAEADCLALLMTTAALGNEWIDWVKENSCMFSNCKIMWGM